MKTTQMLSIMQQGEHENLKKNKNFGMCIRN